MLRKGIVELIDRVGRLSPRPEMSLTTNGIGFARRAADFVAAGLDRVNISLDSLDRDTFTRLTRRDRLQDVLDALAAAVDAGLSPVKINTVLMRGVNDHEAPDLLRFSLEHGYQLRFIEQMPLDAGHSWTRERMVTADEIQASLSEHFALTPHPGARLGAPAELFEVNGGPATVGIIASVTRPFCGDCDRTRLTADGQIRTCLFSRSETDLRALIRGAAAFTATQDRRQDRRCHRGRVADGDLGQASRSRHRRPVVPAAGPADERHRRLRWRSSVNRQRELPAHARPTGQRVQRPCRPRPTRRRVPPA